jgi:hypothetical protein
LPKNFYVLVHIFIDSPLNHFYVLVQETSLFVDRFQKDLDEFTTLLIALQQLTTDPLDGLDNLSFVAGFGQNLRRAGASLRQFIRTRDPLYSQMAISLLSNPTLRKPIRKMNLSQASPFFSDYVILKHPQL